MKAVVLHHNLNNPGGEAALAIHTIESLHKMGYEVDLVTVQKPNFEIIFKTYGRRLPIKNVRYLFPFKINYLGIYQRLLTFAFRYSYFDDADIIINTNGDNLPYNVPYRIVCMLYVHFPISLLTSQGFSNTKYNRSKLWKTYYKPYQLMAKALIKRALARSNVILANSVFTKNALAMAYPGIKANVLYPPVDIDRFSAAYHSKSREAKVLIISRFSPEKQLDKIISLAQIVDNNITFQLIGLLSPANRQYFNSIRERIKHHGLQHRIILTPNATNEELIQAMSLCSTYLHTMEGEHFGISIIEAMAAGLTPIVPSYGGCTEIIPSHYHYSTLEGAARRISIAISERGHEKIEYFHNLAHQFSLSRFTEKLQQFIYSSSDGRKKVFSPKKHW
jgi:alpha-1,2-mannosyltransferase